MNKIEFGEKIKRSLELRMGERYAIKLQEVRKNNGVTLLGVMVNDANKNIAPTIYLDELYKEWKKGCPIEEIVDLLEHNVMQGMPRKQIDVEFFADFEKVKDKICYKLVNGERNKELLKDIPSLPFLDLAICFFYPFYHEEIGNGCILIKNDHLERWGVSVKDIWKVAEINTKLTYPQQCCPMEEMLLELTRKEARIWPPLPEKNKGGSFAMKVLTNHQRIFGAAVILYHKYLEELAERIGGNFFLLPSSIHEMILLPEKGEVESGFLEKLVRESNENAVEEQEYLSDHVYFFDRKKKKVEIVNA